MGHLSFELYTVQSVSKWATFFLNLSCASMPIYLYLCQISFPYHVHIFSCLRIWENRLSLLPFLFTDFFLSLLWQPTSSFINPLHCSQIKTHALSLKILHSVPISPHSRPIYLSSRYIHFENGKYACSVFLFLLV